MSYYPGLDSNVRDKVKVALDLSSYDTKKMKGCYSGCYI